ncbi:MAG: hypothetical protein ABI778_06495 [Ignavibacteriota bacterium]
MKEEIYNEDELKTIEQEIRSLGLPYSSDEPDERYFTNFRVHLMTRIQENQKPRGFFAAARIWLISSPRHYLSVGGSLAGIVVALMLLAPRQVPEVAQLQPAHSTPEVTYVAPALPQVAKPEVISTSKIRTEHPTFVRIPDADNVAEQNSLAAVADKAADFAALDESLMGSGAEADDPVNLDRLSESELESVIAIAQEMK